MRGNIMLLRGKGEEKNHGSMREQDTAEVGEHEHEHERGILEGESTIVIPGSREHKI
jgi:hypothetical protein